MPWPPFAAPALLALPAALPPAFTPADEVPAVPAESVLNGDPPSEEEQAEAAPQHAATRNTETDAIEKLATATA